MNIRTFFLVVYLVGGFVAAGLSGHAFAAKAGLISEGEALSKFAVATEAYKAEDYDRAVAVYEDILRGGKESGALYYNLGNTYFKRGNLGKAILNYERARRLIPRDGDLNFNLEYARSKAGLSAAEATSWSKLVERRIRNWTDREIAWAFSGLALAGALLHLASLFGQWPAPWRRWTVSLVCVLWLSCVGSFVAKLAAEEDLAFVITPSEARFEPRAEATTHFSLTQGTALSILEEGNAWAKVKRADGKVGWVPEKVFERF